MGLQSKLLARASATGRVGESASSVHTWLMEGVLPGLSHRAAQYRAAGSSQCNQ